MHFSTHPCLLYYPQHSPRSVYSNTQCRIYMHWQTNYTSLIVRWVTFLEIDSKLKINLALCTTRSLNLKSHCSRMIFTLFKIFWSILSHMWCMMSCGSNAIVATCWSFAPPPACYPGTVCNVLIIATGIKQFLVITIPFALYSTLCVTGLFALALTLAGWISR
jgi:hypothetical protein